MARLAEMQCTAVEEGEPALDEAQVAGMRPDIPEWEVEERDGVERLERTFSFKDFAGALAFTDAVGAMAEEQNHHPRLVTEWGSVKVVWWTHKVGGLHQNDFIAAAKTDQLYS